MKQSDVDSISTFEEEVEALRSLLLRSKVPVESEAMTAALDWLSRTTSPEKRERWVSGINSFFCVLPSLFSRRLSSTFASGSTIYLAGVPDEHAKHSAL